MKPPLASARFVKSRSSSAWWRRRPCLVGVVHLGALPGAPGYRGSMERLMERAVADATEYEQAGFDAVIVENFSDAPFYPQRVPAETVAALAVACREVRRAIRLPVGVNCLRNDGLAAMAIAAAAELDFVRINVLAGAAVTDQGIVVGEAHEVARARARLRSQVLIAADVRVKHAAPLASRPIEEEVADLLERAGADMVVVSGGRTGDSPDEERLSAVARAAGTAPVWIGSGLRSDNAAQLLSVASGAIVGTSVKRGGVTTAPVDRKRVQALRHAAESAVRGHLPRLPKNR